MKNLIQLWTKCIKQLYLYFGICKPNLQQQKHCAKNKCAKIQLSMALKKVCRFQCMDHKKILRYLFIFKCVDKQALINSKKININFLPQLITIINIYIN